MGSTSDMAHCEKIRKACSSFGIPCVLRVTSAHKGPDETLRIKAEYEGVSMEAEALCCANKGLVYLMFWSVIALQVMAYLQSSWLWLAEVMVWAR